MVFLHRTGAFAVILSCTGFFSVHAASHSPPAEPGSEWQTRRLMTPTPSQLDAESRGRVFIYDSLGIGQVEAAMDQNFDRIENMMFTRVHHPPTTEGGSEEVEDDGCD